MNKLANHLFYLSNNRHDIFAKKQCEKFVKYLIIVLYHDKMLTEKMCQYCQCNTQELNGILNNLQFFVSE